MSIIKEEKIKEEIKNLAARFLSIESNRTSLITVTNVEISDKNARSTVFFTVFPESAEEKALEFTKRMRSDFRDYVRENSKLGRIPFFDFKIDYGEKNRQRIDQISNMA